ncbi:MAG: GxxExxY protein [Desulfuromonas sp.]|uniref:GxxExxY protein n=1 Tax=Desulfuromonas sp. TaxID=892 RepID=UPI000CBF9010|nr:GxxExxY protein [Desulfuromonas sp.]PLX86166.1 MAG: GxxExxY protein [Desulfuromonas sp.]
MGKENHISRLVMDAAFHVHSALGPGLLESVYENVLAYELARREIRVERQVPVAVTYEGKTFDEGFRADLVVADSLIVELKSVEKVIPVHKKQLLTYLRLSGKKLGLLINFGESRLKDGIFRVVNGL